MFIFLFPTIQRLNILLFYLMCNTQNKHIGWCYFLSRKYTRFAVSVKDLNYRLHRGSHVKLLLKNIVRKMKKF